MSGSSTTPFAAKHFHNMNLVKILHWLPIASSIRYKSLSWTIENTVSLTLLLGPPLSCLSSLSHHALLLAIVHICHRHFPLPRKPSRPIQIHLLGLSIDVTLFNKPYLFSNLMLGIPTLQSHGIVCLSQI